MKILIFVIFCFISVGCWVNNPAKVPSRSRKSVSLSGKSGFQSSKRILSVIFPAILSFVPLSKVVAANKLYNLPEEEIVRIVQKDTLERQALNTADFTREIYDEQCRFQDEIDIYPIDQYISGTKALFDRKLSHVDLTSPITIETKEGGNQFIKFQFKEKLAFNFPLLKPIVSLSGRVELERDKQTGLIIYSRERWNESILNILKSLHFGMDYESLLLHNR